MCGLPSLFRHIIWYGSRSCWVWLACFVASLVVFFYAKMPDACRPASCPRYAEWLKLHPEHLTEMFAFLMEGFASPDVMPAATTAIKVWSPPPVLFADILAARSCVRLVLLLPHWLAGLRARRLVVLWCGGCHHARYVCLAQDGPREERRLLRRAPCWL